MWIKIFIGWLKKIPDWAKLENEVKEYQVIPITTVERDYNQESNSDEDEPVEPPTKKKIISYGR